MTSIHQSKSILIAWCLLLSAGLFSQTTITLGSPDFSGDQFSIEAPYSHDQTSLRSQTLILGTELQNQGLGQGEITHIGFQVTTLAANGTLDDFRMSMGHAISDFNFQFQGSLSEVLAPADYTPTAGWNLHALDTPFSWDGTSDIVLETCYQNAGPGGGQETSIWFSFFAENAYKESDHFGGNPACDDFQAEDLYSFRPMIQLTWQPPMQAPDAAIDINSIGVCSGTVSFSDASLYSPDAWLWHFGDGTTSNLQDPIHTYTSSGTYTVSLVATNAFGSDSIALVDAVTISLAGTPPAGATCIPMTQDQTIGFGPVAVSLNGTLVSSGNGTIGYEDLTCSTFMVDQGIEYTLLVEADGPSQNHVVAWIDYNADGTFTEDEKVLSQVTPQFASTQLTVSSAAFTDSTLRMRVMSDFYLLGEPDPCTDPEGGQADDYSIRINPNTIAPTASFIASPLFSCDGTIEFTDTSPGVPTGWLWQFGDGEISNNQHPTHTYQNSGTYTVQLTVQNAFGMDDTVMTDIVEVDLSQQLTPACEPNTLSHCCGYGILSVQLEGINNSSAGGEEGYQDYSCTQVAEVTAGESYPIIISLGQENAHDTHVFFDLNDDGVFAASELVFSGLNTSDINSTLNVPAFVPIVETRLRMRVLSDFVGNGNSGCADVQFGQVEDYSVIIYPDTTPPTADFTASPLLSCDGVVSFTNLSLNSSDFVWYFGDSETSTDISPTHTYSSEGEFTVSLVSSNDYGVDSIAFINLITVDFDGVCDTTSMVSNGVGEVLTTCSGFLADDGGPYDPYSNNSTSSQTILVPEGNYVRLEFVSFFYQNGNDFLLIFDGEDESAPMIGQYTGGALPSGGVIQSTGNAITLRQITNFFGQFDGFLLEWSCVPVGIAEQSIDQLILYPNPSESTIRIAQGLDRYVDQLRIMDNTGRLIAIEKGPAIEWDLNYLPPGNYLIEISAADVRSRQRLIIR